MFILSFKTNSSIVDDLIEMLQINDIYNSFYESPLEITTDNYGYGYEEKENEPVILKVAFEGEKENLDEFSSTVVSIINLPLENIEEINYDYAEYTLPAIHIDNKWVLAHPDEIIEDKTKINFISEGAFGTGIHETTQDILKVILNTLDLKGKTVLDIGTGSGILAIASSIAGASSVLAVDIRDVYDEVMQNATINNLNNVKVFVGDILADDSSISKLYDWIYINIGGEETKMFMPFIKKHLKSNGTLLVSGLVEWSFAEVCESIESFELKLDSKYQTNEWITAIFSYS